MPDRHWSIGDVDFAIRGMVGEITLNRPASINALTTDIVQSVDATLATWAHDPDITQVILSGAGDRGLCAGADLRAMRDSARSADGSGPEFFRCEYRLNARIATYPKPYVAVMDGITMGGGIGLSAHGSVRVVTERSRLAMPEVRIGLVPDVGGTWLLAAAPGETGTFVALTAHTVGPGDAIAMGLADRRVDSGRVPELLERMRDEPAGRVVADIAVTPGDAPVQAMRSWIDECFAADSVPDILDALETSTEPEAAQAAHTMRAMSPMALAVTLESLRRVRTLTSLEEALEQEFRVSCACLAHQDLNEGIRALIVDKDNNPHWSPADISHVDSDAVRAFFRDTPHGSLDVTRLS